MLSEIKNNYKIKINCIEKSVHSFRELLNYVVYDYDIIEIENLNDKDKYSEQEKQLIETIIRYQTEMTADLEILRFVSKDEIKDFSEIDYAEQARILRRKNKLNKGISYITVYDIYTSTTLYEEIKGTSYGRKDFCYYATDLVTVVKRTMELYDGTKIKFSYPYKEDKVLKKVNYLDELYEEAIRVLRGGKEFKLVNPRVYYSWETIRNINKIRRIIEKEKPL